MRNIFNYIILGMLLLFTASCEIVPIDRTGSLETVDAYAELKLPVHKVSKRGSKELYWPGNGVYGPGRAYYKVGNPYKVKGRYYYPRVDQEYNRKGIASWYGPNFHGKFTANKEIFSETDYTAAHKTLPMPSVVEVTNLDTGKTLKVRINDRGPFKDNRILDLSKSSAEYLGAIEKGKIRIKIRYLREETNRLHQYLFGGVLINSK